jgi:hypothetical protein
MKDNFLSGSVIINSLSEIDLLRGYMNSNFCTTELLYSGSKDGWSTSFFHNKVDNNGAVICIIRSSNGNVFGGYTKLGFDSSN